jgi:DNA polymerase I-like protein with 3'-5' exonuclease and polymerase domains
MSSLCGERDLIEGYNLRTSEFPKGKDFYAMLASSAFGMDYWDCTEFNKEGKYQAEGKARRQAGKVIQLGVSYGMGVKLLVEGINAKKKPTEKKMTIEEGEKMMSDFFGKFKALAAWKNYNMARLDQFGYMETALGRRRRLYDIWLDDYEVKPYKYEKVEDIFIDLPNVVKVEDKERTIEISKHLNSIKNPFEAKEYIEKLKIDPLNHIKSNGGFKSKPKTQATNFVIQGSSASLTKRAMVAIWDHPDSKRYGIGIVAPVHDEILIEGWMENRKEVLNLLTTCMSNSAKGVFEVAMVCDGVLETSWNVDHFMDKVMKEYRGNPKEGKKPLTLEEIYAKYPETDPDCLKRMALGEFDVETEFYIPSKIGKGGVC